MKRDCFFFPSYINAAELLKKKKKKEGGVGGDAGTQISPAIWILRRVPININASEQLSAEVRRGL